MLAFAFSDRNERLMHDDNVKKAAWSVLVLAEGMRDWARWSLVLAQRPHQTDNMVTLWAVRVEARTFETNRATL